MNLLFAPWLGINLLICLFLMKLWQSCNRQGTVVYIALLVNVILGLLQERVKDFYLRFQTITQPKFSVITCEVSLIKMQL